jgi:hypothetical protein
MAVVRDKLTDKRVDRVPWTQSLRVANGWMSSLLIAGVYVLAALAVYVLVGHALSWGKRKVEDVRYGYPRMVHLSGVVGHGDSPESPTHFIALNLEHQVSVLQLPAGDTREVQVLRGPYLFGEAGHYEVPSLALRDVDGDGLSDLLLTVRGEVVVFLNKDGDFRLITAEERVVLKEQGYGR